MSTRRVRDAAFVAGRYLLDTHVFIYLAQFPDRLPKRLQALIEDARNDLHFSIASLWELQIKLMTGRLALGGAVDRLLAVQQRENSVSLLPIDVPHVVELVRLPLHHRDPFDRMLIAQARVEELTLLSNDEIFSTYDVSVRW